jgi:hypothetical protein
MVTQQATGGFRFQCIKLIALTGVWFAGRNTVGYVCSASLEADRNDPYVRSVVPTLWVAQVSGQQHWSAQLQLLTPSATHGQLPAPPPRDLSVGMKKILV